MYVLVTMPTAASIFAAISHANRLLLLFLLIKETHHSYNLILVI